MPKPNMKPKPRSYIPIPRRRKQYSSMGKYTAPVIDSQSVETTDESFPETLQLSKPVTEVKSEDVMFVGEPINLQEVEKMRAALVGLIPPVQSTDSLERLRRKIEELKNTQESNPIAEDVLKTLSGDEPLLKQNENPLPNPPSMFEKLSSSYVDENNNIVGERKINFEEKPKKERVGVLERSNWVTDCIFKREPKKAEGGEEKSPETSLQSIFIRKPKQKGGSRAKKTIFSLEPPMTNSKIVSGPGENGDFGLEALKCPSVQLGLEPNLQQLPQDQQETEVEDEKVSYDVNEIHAPRQETFPEQIQEDPEKEIKEKSFLPCAARLPKESSLILLPDTIDHYQTCRKKPFRATMEVENFTDEVYGYKVRCNYTALNHFYVTPEAGIIPPRGTSSVVIKTKKVAFGRISSEDVEDDKFVIKFFPLNTTDVRELDNEFYKVSVEFPERIKTQFIRQVVLWDTEEFLRISDKMDSVVTPAEEKELSSLKEKLDVQYSELILPQVLSKSRFHSTQIQMIGANQKLRNFLPTITRWRNLLHIFLFLSLYVLAFVTIVPYMQTEVVMLDEVKVVMEEPPFYARAWYAITDCYGRAIDTVKSIF